MTHIVQFELLALAGSVGRIVASHHLPPSCDAWFAAEELTQPIPVVDKLLIDNGTRAHNTHVAFEYVDELRKLIQRRLAQDAPHLRDAWIVFDLALRLPLPKLFRIQVLLDIVGIDVFYDSYYSPYSIVKHIDRALLQSIRQWFANGTMPKHQTLGLKEGYTEVTLNPNSDIYIWAPPGYEGETTPCLTEEMKKEMHEEAVRKEEEHEGN